MATISGYREYVDISGVLQSGFYLIDAVDRHDFIDFRPVGDSTHVISGVKTVISSGTVEGATGENQVGASNKIPLNTNFTFRRDLISAEKTNPAPLDNDLTRGFMGSTGVVSGFGFYQESLVVQQPLLAVTTSGTVTGVAGPGIKFGTYVHLFVDGAEHSNYTVRTVGHDKTVVFDSLTLTSGESIKLVIERESGNIESAAVVVS